MPSAPERLFSFAALDQRPRRQIAGVLGLRLQRAEPALVLAAGRSDAGALVEGNRAVGEKGLHAGIVDDLHQLVGDGIIVRDHDIFGPLAGAARDQAAGDLEGLQRLALGILYLERHAEAAGGGLHALRDGHPVDFVGLAGIDECDGLRVCSGAAQRNGKTCGETGGDSAMA